MQTRQVVLLNMFGRETPPVVIGDWLQRVERTGSVYYYGVYDNLVAWMPAGGGHGISWAAIPLPGIPPCAKRCTSKRDNTKCWGRRRCHETSCPM